MNKLLASASALAICLSSSLGATKTNDWFKVDFESYTANAVIAGVSQTGGAWSKAGADASTMTNMTSPAKGEIGKLDTQGDQLTWTPTAASTQDVVLIDTDVYLVGSDEAPTTVTTDVQTEVYLKNILNASYEITSSVLCAHVYDTVGSSNAWVELDGVTVTHQSWVNLRIEMNYKTAGTPEVSFWVNGIRMEKVGTSTSSFRVMDATKTGVNSVSFMGTGYIDNFIGRQVEDIVSGPTFDPPQVSTNGVPAFAGGSIDTSVSGALTATFKNTLGGEALQYVQLTGPNGYVRTYRTSNGAAVEFDTTGLASGNYDVTAYYGAAPTVVPVGYKPVAEAGGAKPAAEVVEVGEAKFLRVNVKPVSGLYYTLFVGTDGALPANLSAGADSVLAYPDHQDRETLVIDLPVPTDPNGVNLIKIYASDEAYEAKTKAPAEAAAPDAP